MTVAGASATQGLPSRRHPGRIQGRADTPARRAEGLQLTAIADSAGGAGETVWSLAGRTGGRSWTPRAALDPGERIVVNMGPQHPSTHGVLRLILEIEGETVVKPGAESATPESRRTSNTGTGPRASPS
ncbi:hypothetical protein ABLN97_11735 [Mycobacterium tuberculosis]